MNATNIFSSYRVDIVFATISILILSSIFSPFTTAEDRALSAMEQPGFLTSGLYGGGLTFIGRSPYIQLQAQPDIPLGKVNIGFDLVLLYNPYATDADAQFLAEDGESWDSPSTWLRLIRYVSYNQPYDPFYFRFGELDYLTIGHGSVMSGYSNYDRRGLSLNFRKSNNRNGVETMLNDFGDPTIFGGRVFQRPFLRPEPENNNFFTRFEVGATYLTDINPNLQETGESPLTALGADVGFPIIERSAFRLDLYNDFTLLHVSGDPDEVVPEEPLELEPVMRTSVTRLESEPIGGDTDNATEETMEFVWGDAIGIGLALPKAIFKVEYRILGDGYIPSIFDYTYHSAKSLSPDPDVPEFLGLETNVEERHGFYTQVFLRPTPNLQFLGTFEDYNISNPKLYMAVAGTELIPRFGFRVLYTKRDIGEGEDTNFFTDLFNLNEKSAFIVEASYEVFPPLVTIVTREYRFRRVETAEGISQFEPIHKTSFVVGVRTDF